MTTSRTRAFAALTATMAVLAGCSQPSDCVTSYRGGCLTGPMPAAPAASSPPPVATAPAPPPPPVVAPKPAVPYGDPARFAAEDDRQCRSYGLKYGTHDYADCRIRLSAQHRGLDPDIGATPSPR
ncbi:MAG TPA: hypothetical protein VHB27_23735 [Rhodopila sp.]|uniref:hypothetical protein n=1 Tax=Rhodopila sp. TaxID=2480087 RepID=UPI002C38EC0D|nr:hypothetical protein [Rhodopila sp.]HVY18251.1 hypothetical protein [Rhodopila sp.]